MDIHATIKHIHPEAEFTLNNNDYTQLTWLSKNITKPTFAELTTAWEDAEAVKQWRLDAATDDFTSRDIENILNALDPAERARVDSSTLEKLARKKNLRARRPS